MVGYYDPVVLALMVSVKFPFMNPLVYSGISTSCPLVYGCGDFCVLNLHYFSLLGV